MASNDSLSPLAERLLSRHRSGPRVGAGSRLFERLGLENPFTGGAVRDASVDRPRFSFLSAEDYFAELRGLTDMRRGLLQRIGRVRASIRAHERFEQRIATASVRAIRMDALEMLEPTLVDWSSQEDSNDQMVEQGRIAGRAQGRRATAAERALRAEISAASRVLEALEKVAASSRGESASGLRGKLPALETLGERQRSQVAERLGRQLKGVSAVAARGTELDRVRGGQQRTGDRPLAVAQRRQSHDEPRGLRRQLDTSPVMMELEQRPASPEVPEARRAPSAPRRVAREHAHRDAPIAGVLREARSQSSVGRAGPPSTGSQAEMPVSGSRRQTLRPTARVAQVARRAAAVSLSDTTRGLGHVDAPENIATNTPSARVGRRMEAGLLDANGHVASGLAYARPMREEVPSPEPVLVLAGGEAEEAPAGDGMPVPRARAVSRGHSTPSNSLRAARVDLSSAPMGRAVARGAYARRIDERSILASVPHVPSTVERTAAPLVEHRVPVGRPVHPARDGSGRSVAGVPDSLPVEREQLRSAELASRPVASVLDDAAMMVPAFPETIAVEATDTPTRRPRIRRSAQETVLTEGSRRGSARPTVRAASRAMAQERLGARGRLLAPSVSAHVDVVAGDVARQADVRRVAPFNRGVVATDLSTDGVTGRQLLESATVRRIRASRQALTDDELALPSASGRRSESLDEASVPARSARRTATAEERRPAARGAGIPEASEDRLVGASERIARRADAADPSSVRRRETDAVPEGRIVDALSASTSTSGEVVAGASSRATVGSRVVESSTSLLETRLAGSSRAAERAIERPRVGATGAMISPDAVAPFRSLRDRTVETVLPLGMADEPFVEQAPRPNRPVAERVMRARVASSASSAESGTDGLPARRSSVSERAPVENVITSRPARALRRRETGDAFADAAAPKGIAERVDPTTPTSGAPTTAMRLEPTALTVARAESSTSEEPSGLASRASQRGREVAPEARRALTPTVTPEAQGGVARRTLSRTEASASAHHTPDAYGAPARVFSTPKTPNEPTLAYRTPHQEVERSATVRTAGGALSPTGTFLTPGTQWADAEVSPIERAFGRRGHAVESGLGRASRRLESRRRQLTDSPTLPGVDRLLVNPAAPSSALDAGRPVGRTDLDAVPARGPRSTPTTSRALARSEVREDGGSILARPVVDDAFAARHTASLAAPLAASELRLGATDAVVQPESIAGGRRALAPRPDTSGTRVQRALKELGTKRLARRGEETVLTLPAARRSIEPAGVSSDVIEHVARVQVSEDGRVLRSSIGDAPEPVVARPVERAEQRAERPVQSAVRRPLTERSADGQFVSAESEVEGGGAHRMDQTLGSLTLPREHGPQEQRPLLRRRSWSRRGAAAELGVLTPTLADADHVPEDHRLDEAPAWARRAGRGTAARADEQRREVRPEREANGLMGALARAERPDEVVRVIIDRRTEIREVRGELPQEAVRLMERIGSFSGADVDAIRQGQRVMAAQMPQQNMLQSRSLKGGADVTQLSAGQDGMGSTKIMKLADKLMGLIHLAENNRQKEAQDQVRMAQDSLEARAEGGAKFPGMSVEDHDMNIEQLQKSVLDSVLEHFEDLDSRREDPDGHNKWW